MRATQFLVLSLLLACGLGQPDPGEELPETPRSGVVPRFPRIPSSAPPLGGQHPSTSALVQAADVHTALDDVMTRMDDAAARDQTLNQSASLGPDDGKYLSSKI